MIMVYNNENDDEKCKGDGEKKAIYSLHTALLKHENEFYIRCLPFFTMRHRHKALEMKLKAFLCAAW
jgi:hypothetical protein